MNIRQQRWSAGAVTIAICSLPFFLSALTSAQSLNLSGSSNCTAADFDTELKFANGPADYYTIIVEKHNISDHPCLFDGSVYGPSFVPDRVEGHAPYGICYFCDERLPDGQTPLVPPIAAKPGQVARQTFRWRTESSNQPCLQPEWMSGPAVVVVGSSLLKRVCSDVEVSRFTIIELGSATRSEQAHALRLSSQKNTYYLGELFSLRVTAAEPKPKLEAKEGTCPTLYLRQRSPDGSTRIDEVRPLAFKGCGPPALGHQLGDWTSGFDLSSGANSRWEGIGEHIMEAFEMAGSADEAEVRFLSSNVLSIRIADPAAIARKWQSRVKGIAVDITLDKDTFELDEDVPLHLAIADLDAEPQLFSWDPLWDPCLTIGIEVRDSRGRSLTANERFSQSSICTGHGFGPRPILKGKVIPIERTLRREGWLPNRTGTYTVVITWAPCAPQKNRSPDAQNKAAFLETYAIVQASATLHVVKPKDFH